MLCADFLAPSAISAPSTTDPQRTATDAPPLPPAVARSVRQARRRAATPDGRAAPAPRGMTDGKRARAPVERCRPTPKRLRPGAPPPPAAQIPPARVTPAPAASPRARSPPATPASCVTPARFPSTLDNYSTYFDRPSTRRSPRVRIV
ncbi:hypothetical protein AB1Y20_023680 [Prymnesium parvum]|uniref:Uncharacterized protein n=1 Tax=Prymnesium parvum TaxID=97485 RepID=A0AB34JH22_PRYPA